MTGPPFQLDQRGTVVVAAFDPPRLDAGLMQQAVDEMIERLRCHNAVHFVLDLGKTEFMSSACLGVLVQFMQETEHVRGRIALASCRPTVAGLFRITRLDTIFGLYDDVDQAVAEVVHG